MHACMHAGLTAACQVVILCRRRWIPLVGAWKWLCPLSPEHLYTNIEGWLSIKTCQSQRERCTLKCCHSIIYCNEGAAVYIYILYIICVYITGFDVILPHIPSTLQTSKMPIRVNKPAIYTWHYRYEYSVSSTIMMSVLCVIYVQCQRWTVMLYIHVLSWEKK